MCGYPVITHFNGWSVYCSSFRTWLMLWSCTGRHTDQEHRPFQLKRGKYVRCGNHGKRVQNPCRKVSFQNWWVKLETRKCPDIFALIDMSVTPRSNMSLLLKPLFWRKLGCQMWVSNEKWVIAKSVQRVRYWYYICSDLKSNCPEMTCNAELTDVSCSNLTHMVIYFT